MKTKTKHFEMPNHREYASSDLSWDDEEEGEQVEDEEESEQLYCSVLPSYWVHTMSHVHDIVAARGVKIIPAITM